MVGEDRRRLIAGVSQCGIARMGRGVGGRGMREMLGERIYTTTLRASVNENFGFGR
jgi:hypothetical protein